MDVTETNDKLIIVNRSQEHLISKQLLRKVPYFEKMLSHDLKESTENKVVLDFNEQAFEIFLEYIHHGNIFIEMDHVINLYNMSDYFGMERFSQECMTYFHDEFSVEHIPAVIPQVTKTTKLLSSDDLDAFICRYFLQIANIFSDNNHPEITFWLKYSIEAIQYICALDLMINSEIQVFNAIMRWVNFKAGSRKRYLKRLLKFVRWCHLVDSDLTKIKQSETFKSSGFEIIFCSSRKLNCDCNNRTKQSYFVMIEQSNGTDLRIKVLDNKFLQLSNRLMKLNSSMPLKIFHEKHLTDILYDSGRKVIRIDWNENKYRLFDSIALYYKELHKLIVKKDIIERTQTYTSSTLYGCSFFEANEKFICITMQNGLLHSFLTPKAIPSSSSYSISNSNSDFLATVLDNNIYLLSRNLEFFELKSKYNMLEKAYYDTFASNRFKFENMILTVSPGYDGRVILVDKVKRDFIFFNIYTREWSSVKRMTNLSSIAVQKESNMLRGFTSAFIPFGIINT